VSGPRLVITVEVEGGPARFHLEGVDSPADAVRLRCELAGRPARAELRGVLRAARDELARLTKADAWLVDEEPNP
jgi:hypothetical protein